MKSRSPAKSTISSNLSSISFRVKPMANPPSMIFRSPDNSLSKAAPTPSRLGRAEAYMAPLLAGVSPTIARMSVDLPEPLLPMTPMLSFSYAVNETPLSACTLRSLRDRSKSLRASATPARLPVANTRYSTWTSSTMTTGLRSVISPIAFLCGPEVEGAGSQQKHRPDRGIQPIHRVDFVIGPVDEKSASNAHEFVQRDEVEDSQNRLIVRGDALDAEKHATGVKGQPGHEGQQLAEVTEVDCESCSDQSNPGVEHEVQRNERDQKDPLHLRRSAHDEVEQEHDDDARKELEQALGHGGQGQRHSREVEALHERVIGRNGLSAIGERGREELEHEDADDDELDEVRRTAVGHQEAENQSVDERVQHRLEDDPTHTEAVTLVFGFDAELRKRVDELSAPPHFGHIDAKRWARANPFQAFVRRVVGKAHLLTIPTV